MFVLNYMPAGTDTIPSGWSSVDEDKSYPALSTRAPQPSQLDGRSSNGSIDQQGSDSGDDDNGYRPVSAPTRMVEEESDEDDDDLLGNKVVSYINPSLFLSVNLAPPPFLMFDLRILTED